MDKKIILVVGHGSRMAESNKHFENFVKHFHQRIPNEEIVVGYVELAQPQLKEALEGAAKKAAGIIVLPLFLLTAGHIKHDICEAIKDTKNNFPNVKFTLATALGLHEKMIQLVHKRMRQAAQSLPENITKTSVLMIGRGSSDKGANSDFCKLVRLIEEDMSYPRIDYCFMAVVKPEVEEVLQRLIDEKPEAILVHPYLIFSGVLHERIKNLVEKYAQQYPEIHFRITETLGEDELIFDVFEKRLLDAQAGKEMHLCESCGGVSYEN